MFISGVQGWFNTVKAMIVMNYIGGGVANLTSDKIQQSFPGGSDGKESACNTGDPGLIPRSERYNTHL